MSNPNNEPYPTGWGPVARDEVYQFIDQMQAKDELGDIIFELCARFLVTSRGAKEMYLDWKYDSANGIYNRPMGG